MSTSKSLLSAITDAIATNTKGSVILNQRSFLSHLFENNKRERIFSNDSKWNWSTTRGESFIITKWILHALGMFVRAFIWFVHAIWYLIIKKNRCEKIKEVLYYPWNWLKNVIDPKKKKNRKEYLKNTNREQGKKLLNFYCNPAIDLLVVLLALVLSIIFLVHITTFAINDIMFSPMDTRTNDKGVTTINQPCLESHSFFLKNAASFWESTGIAVKKGDKVTFSVSGSMYSDVGEMYDAAKDDRTLIYQRRLFDTKPNKRDSIGLDYCIYHRKDARFGALLCQVTTEHCKPTWYQDAPGERDSIVQITQGNTVLYPEKDGILHITFNDILLTREIVSKILTDPNDDNRLLADDLVNSEYFLFIKDKKDINEKDTNKKYRDNIQSLYNSYHNTCGCRCNIIEKIKTGVNEFYDSVSPDSTVWFLDNLGDYLINIRIERKILGSNIKCFKKPFIVILREIDHFIRQGFCKSNVFWILLGVFLYLTIDILVSGYVKRKKEEDESSASKTSVNADESQSTKEPETSSEHKPYRKKTKQAIERGPNRQGSRNNRIKNKKV